MGDGDGKKKKGSVLLVAPLTPPRVRQLEVSGAQCDSKGYN